MADVANLDGRILAMIDEVRAEHGSCTAREVARRLKVAHTYVQARLHLMKAQGKITFTSLPGSIQRVDKMAAARAAKAAKKKREPRRVIPGGAPFRDEQCGLLTRSSLPDRTGRPRRADE